MEVIRQAHNLRPRHRGSAVTLGNFDGVHRGHQALLRQLLAAASEQQLRATVVTFEPHPLELLAPDKAPPRLCSLREKLELLDAAGVDQVLVLRFDARLAACRAADFVTRLLVEGLGARRLVIGDDYRFGQGREGDLNLLRRLGTQHGYTVERLHTVTGEDEQRIGSSAVRAALARGDLAIAARLLGRRYRISGRVVRGQRLGRELGAPTANIAHRRRCALRHGVYCVTANGAPAVANLGVRPTVEADTVQHLEVHLLDAPADLDLYGRRLSIEFRQFLRPEARFANLDELTAAISADVTRAREYFAGKLDGDDLALAI